MKKGKLKKLVCLIVGHKWKLEKTIYDCPEGTCKRCGKEKLLWKEYPMMYPENATKSKQSVDVAVIRKGRIS